MIQFNLLPDLKLKYIKAKRFKHTAMIVSFLVAASSLAVFIFLFMTVYVFQKNHIANMSNDINAAQKKLDDTKDLKKVLTIQNQLNSLPELHDKKPVTSRIFGYMNQLTPNAATVGNIELDFGLSTLNVKGSADSLSTINKFVDTIKFIKYEETKPGDKTVTKDLAFSEVVLNNYTKTNDSATYNLSFKFNPIIFDSRSNIKLIVPNITSTRSETEKPNELFIALPKKETKAP